jgi:hypothetical protein
MLVLRLQRALPNPEGAASPGGRLDAANRASVVVTVSAKTCDAGERTSLFLERTVVG